MDSDHSIQKNKEVYDKISEQFAETRKFLWDDLKPLIQYTKPKDRVLDLGCGTGRLYQLFEKFQGSEQILYTGIDNSDGQIAVARNQYPLANFLVGDMTALPCEDNSFDIVYAIASFHHLADDRTRVVALEEIRRVLAPQGLLVMTNWNLSGEWGREKVASGKYREIGEGNYIVPWINPEGEVVGERLYHSFTQEEMQTLLLRMGFFVQEQYFTKHGEKKNHEDGMNLVTIAQVKY
jgi:ubiquinone/menaquinone biosynthesis C-methylase UbiE